MPQVSDIKPRHFLMPLADYFFKQRIAKPIKIIGKHKIRQVATQSIFLRYAIFFVHLLPSSALLLLVTCMPCALLGAIHFDKKNLKKKERKKENFEAKINLKKLWLTLPADDSNFIWI